MGEYKIYDDGLRIGKPLNKADRKDAKAAYDYFIGAIPERIKMLRSLVKESGYPLAEGRDFLPILNDFYFGACSEIIGEEKPGPLELSLAIDINMYVGDLLVTKYDNLHWQFNKFKDINFQRPVIMGFANVNNKRCNREFSRILIAYANRIIKGQPKEEGLFLNLYDSPAKFV